MKRATQVERAIADIDGQIAVLQRAKDTLVKAASETANAPRGKRARKPAPSLDPATPGATAPH